MNKIKQVMLVDDCKATNYISRLIIEKYGFATEVVEFLNGYEAISYLTTAQDGKYPQPDLIFLDINMPVMNGWEFIESYKLLPDEQKAGVVVVMLTTSLNPDDEMSAGGICDVKSFSTKPLTLEKLDAILAEYYPASLRKQS